MSDITGAETAVLGDAAYITNVMVLADAAALSDAQSMVRYTAGADAWAGVDAVAGLRVRTVADAWVCADAAPSTALRPRQSADRWTFRANAASYRQLQPADAGALHDAVAVLHSLHAIDRAALGVTATHTNTPAATTLLQATDAGTLGDASARRRLTLGSDRALLRTAATHTNTPVSATLNASDAAALANTYRITRSAIGADIAIAGDVLHSTASHYVSAIDVGALGDIERRAQSMAFTDGILIGSQYHLWAIIRRSEREAAAFNDSATPIRHTFTRCTDSCLFVDGSTTIRMQSVHASEVAVLNDSSSSSGSAAAAQLSGTGAAWTTALDVLNMARWTNQPIISAAMVTGHPIVTTPAGVFELTGHTDAGAVFTPRLVMPISDLGSRELARIDTVYVVTRPGTGVALVVTPEDDPAGNTHEYHSRPRIDSSHVPLRIKTGRGIRARLWSLELRGIPGHAFALREASAELGNTSRRV